MSWDLKYGKHVEVKPVCDIPAVFDMDDLCYTFTYKDKIDNVRYFMKYLYKCRLRVHKFDRGREFPYLMDLIKRYESIDHHLIIRMVEWQYIDNDGFWIKDRPPRLKDAIFISIAYRDYRNKHKVAKIPK